MCSVSSTRDIEFSNCRSTNVPALRAHSQVSWEQSEEEAQYFSGRPAGQKWLGSLPLWPHLLVAWPASESSLRSPVSLWTFSLALLQSRQAKRLITRPVSNSPPSHSPLSKGGLWEKPRKAKEVVVKTLTLPGHRPTQPGWAPLGWMNSTQRRRVRNHSLLSSTQTLALSTEANRVQEEEGLQPLTSLQGACLSPDCPRQASSAHSSPATSGMCITWSLLQPRHPQAPFVQRRSSPKHGSICLNFCNWLLSCQSRLSTCPETLERKENDQNNYVWENRGMNNFLLTNFFPKISAFNKALRNYTGLE